MRFIFSSILALIIISSLSSLAYAAQPEKPANIPWDLKKQGKLLLVAREDPAHRLWIGTEESGLWCWDPAATKPAWTHYLTRDGLGDNTITSIAFDQLGRTWVGHLNHGLSVYNGQHWKIYNPFNGPLGNHVYAITTCPKDGDVWIATEVGLSRYSITNNSWTYYTRADGLPSDQASAIAFDKSGKIYLATTCDGIATASPADNYHSWKTITAVDRVPTTATGDGLPSNLINDILVARDGSIYAATSAGLARSTDLGQSWKFFRGKDWRDKTKSLRNAPPKIQPPRPGTLLLKEDNITSLTEDAAGMIWLGYLKTGYECLDPSQSKVVFSSPPPPPKNFRDTDIITGICPISFGYPLLTTYGGGLIRAARSFAPAAATQPAPASPLAARPAPFPAPASVLSPKTYDALMIRLGKPRPPAAGALLGEDWLTQGDWVGRYGRNAAILPNYEAYGSRSYPVAVNVGLRTRADDGMYMYYSTTDSKNPRGLLLPGKGNRVEGEWNDGTFQYNLYPLTTDGPDLIAQVSVPDGAHRISLYFINFDGDRGLQRFRDYVMELKVFNPDKALFYSSPTLARTRVRRFRSGVYKQFIVTGPATYGFLVGRNYSNVTKIAAIFCDRISGPLPPAEQAPDWFGKIAYLPPQAQPAKATGAACAAADMIAALDDAKPSAAIFDKTYRLFAYRLAEHDNADPLLLSAWRWQMPLWTASDREEFNAAMSQAAQANNALNQQPDQPPDMNKDSEDTQENDVIMPDMNKP